MRNIRYNNRFNRGGRPHQTAPRASTFEAFSTRCGKAASSKEITKYYASIPNTDLLDSYIINPPTIVWDAEQPITTWDELTTFLQSLTVGMHYDAILQNDIIVPSGSPMLTIPLTDNAIVRVRSETGFKFTIDFDGGGSSGITWMTSSYISSIFMFDSVILTNIGDPLVFMRFQGLEGVIINDVTLENATVVTTFFYLKTSPLVVANSIFRNLVCDTAYGAAFHAMINDTLFYNCLFQNITSTLGKGAIYYNSLLGATDFHTTMLGCVFEGCSTPESCAAVYAGLNDSTIYMANCIFRNNSAALDSGALTVRGGGSAMSTFQIVDCEFSGNEAGDEGGAIYVEFEHAYLDISGDTCFNGNEAGTAGGAIAVASQNIENVTVESTVEFSDNVAMSAYLIADADKAAYASKVSATAFSSEFVYGWNNYDIQYTDGTELAAINVPINGCSGQTLTTSSTGQFRPLPTIPSACLSGGKAFRGWYKDAALSVPVTTATIFLSGSIIYPKLVTLYTITLNPQNGGSNTTVTTNDDGTINNPGTPTVPSGATFDGWYTTAQTGGTKWTAAMTFTANTTLYARWTCATGYTYSYTNKACEINKYTVTINGPTGVIWTGQVNYGAKVTKPADPTQAHATFDNWYLHNTNTVYNFNNTVTSALTIDARWTCATGYTNSDAAYKTGTCSFTGCPAGMAANSSGVCCWEVKVGNGTGGYTTLLVPPGTAITAADMPTPATPTHGSFDKWVIGGTAVTFPYTPTNTVTIDPTFTCDTGYTSAVNNGCSFTGCPTGMAANSSGVCCWEVKVGNGTGGYTTLLVPPGTSIAITDLPTPTTPTHGSFDKWVIGGTAVTFPYTPTNTVTIDPTFTCDTGYTSAVNNGCSFTGCPTGMAANSSGVCCWEVKVGNGAGGYTTLLVPPGTAITAADMPTPTSSGHGSFDKWVIGGTEVTFPYAPTNTVTIDPTFTCDTGYTPAVNNGCTFTGCPTGMTANSSGVCCWEVNVGNGAGGYTTLLVPPGTAITAADMPTPTNPGHGSFDKWVIGGTEVTFPYTPTGTETITPAYTCDTGYTSTVNNGCTFTGCPAGMAANSSGVCCWEVFVDDGRSVTTLLVEPGNSITEADLPTIPNPIHGAFLGWYVNGFRILFPYAVTESVLVEATISCDANYALEDGDCLATVKIIEDGKVVGVEKHPVGYIYTFENYPHRIPHGKYLGWEVSEPGVTRGLGDPLYHKPGETIVVMEPIIVNLVAVCNEGYTLEADGKCHFIVEPCKCCDCLTPELKDAFEQLTTSVGGSHDAARYILQVIVDKLTDPANTCVISDFESMFNELTKLTGYNQKELCCILSAMTGMKVE